MDRKIDCEWGAPALSALQDRYTHIVIIDLFSFSTCVDIVTAQNAQVIPYHYDENRLALKEFAASHQAQLAQKRGESGYTLSPQSLLRIPAKVKLVLPSPNGSSLCFKARHKSVLVGSLRNADAIANWLNSLEGDVLLIPAGEKWPDSSLRFAYEDLIAAGAIIAKLNGRKSFEAQHAENNFYSSHKLQFENLYHSKSALELIAWNYKQDIDLALQYNISHTVPTLSNGVISNAVNVTRVGI